MITWTRRPRYSFQISEATTTFTTTVAMLCAAVPKLTTHSVEVQDDGSVLVRYAYPQAVETLIKHLYIGMDARDMHYSLTTRQAPGQVDELVFRGNT
jgi:hypothetical protein